MKISLFSARAATLALAGALSCLAMIPAAQGANLILNSSFENGNWDGGQSFVDSSNATTLLYWNNVADRWTPNSGSTWVRPRATTRPTSRSRSPPCPPAARC